MNQQEFDFNNDINEPTYTAEDNLRINEIVYNYQDIKKTINDETIIFNYFLRKIALRYRKD